jgi:HAMP domain-containing protein
MSASNRRSIKNLLINPNFQVKYALYFAASGMAMMGLLFTMMMIKLNGVIAEIPSFSTDIHGMETALTGLIYDISLFTLVAFFANAVFSFGFAIFMTHRVAGAAYNIENYIKEIAAGIYNTDRTLRKNDDLQAVAAALRDLASKLKAKNG